MGIKVDILELQRKSTLAGSLAIQLSNKVSEINSIYYSLDPKVKSRQSIEYSLRNLHQRMQKAQQKMEAMGGFLSVAANKYNNAESAVRARAAALGQVSVGNAVGVGVASGMVRVTGAKNIVGVTHNTGAVQVKAEGKKWYQKNWVKVAVGVAVVATAGAFAVTVGGPILIGAAVGATIGAGVGGVIGGVTSKRSGGNFIDGFADGFVSGAISGAISGAVSGGCMNIAQAAVIDGLTDSSVYIVETATNGGKITAKGVATSFVIGTGFSAVGNVASEKISKIVSTRVKNLDSGNPKIKILNPKDDRLKPVKKGVAEAKFKYKNNPMDNPKAAIDIIENSDAVYSYSPNPTSKRIGKFANKIDWTDPSQVEIARQTRLEYHNNNEHILEKLYSQGYSTEEIARKMVNERNTNRLNSYLERGDMEGYEVARKSNLDTYKNADGPTPESMFEKYGSWEAVINASVSSNPGMDACVGLYDIYHGGN